MKKLHQYILKAFTLPFILTFCIVIFILLMQFLWKYIDDLVGKGLEWYVILELLWYTSASLVPIGLPLAVLLSSIMTFGNLGEKYELVALKSAGLSLQRIMTPLIIATMGISIGAFYFSNYLLPKANLKMGSLLWDVRQQRPALNIKQGVFYNGIEGYSIKVNKKNNNENTLEGIMIYDHTNRYGNNKLILAKKGKMELVENNTFLQLTLEDGYSYEELEPYPIHKRIGSRMRRLKFHKNTIRFNLNSFNLTRTDEELFKDHEQMLNLSQLVSAQDTLKKWMKIRKARLQKSINSRYFFGQHPDALKETGTLAMAKDTNTYHTEEVPFARSKKEALLALDNAATKARNTKLYISVSKSDIETKTTSILRHRVEWHRKFTLSIACLILFFVGAPLGAIIRKGGLGMPVVMSVVFFLLYHVISITGEKMVKEGVIEPQVGMWIASFLFLPLGIFLTYKATTDSVLFDIDTYTRVLVFWKKKDRDT
jgi:lipopolysaccharide export system permease protein